MYISRVVGARQPATAYSSATNDKSATNRLGAAVTDEHGFCGENLSAWFVHFEHGVSVAPPGQVTNDLRLVTSRIALVVVQFEKLPSLSG